jgi:hypothetical protein
MRVKCERDNSHAMLLRGPQPQTFGLTGRPCCSPSLFSDKSEVRSKNALQSKPYPLSTCSHYLRHAFAVRQMGQCRASGGYHLRLLGRCFCLKR